MEKLTSRLLAGVATVLAIFPQTDYSRFVPSRNVEDRMRGHWERVGGHFKKAMQVVDEQQAAKQNYR
jgi:phosphopentomutase